MPRAAPLAPRAAARDLPIEFEARRSTERRRRNAAYIPSMRSARTCLRIYRRRLIARARHAEFIAATGHRAGRQTDRDYARDTHKGDGYRRRRSPGSTCCACFRPQGDALPREMWGNVAKFARTSGPRRLASMSRTWRRSCFGERGAERAERRPGIWRFHRSASLKGMIDERATRGSPRVRRHIHVESFGLRTVPSTRRRRESRTSSWSGDGVVKQRKPRPRRLVARPSWTSALSRAGSRRRRPRPETKSNLTNWRWSTAPRERLRRAPRSPWFSRAPKRSLSIFMSRIRANRAGASRPDPHDGRSDRPFAGRTAWRRATPIAPSWRTSASSAENRSSPPNPGVRPRDKMSVVEQSR